MRRLHPIPIGPLSYLTPNVHLLRWSQVPEMGERGNDFKVEVGLDLCQALLPHVAEHHAAQLAGRILLQGLGQRCQVLVLACLGTRACILKGGYT